MSDKQDKIRKELKEHTDQNRDVLSRPPNLPEPKDPKK